MEEAGAVVSPGSPRARPGKRTTYELLTQAINEARDRGDIELLELIAEREIGELKEEAERVAEEARELAGEVPF